MDDRYILFLALTRPAINRWGIPHKGFLIAFAFTFVFAWWVGHGAGWHQLFYYLVFFPLIIAMRFLAEWDHNFLRLIQIWFNTKAKGLGRRHGAVLSPMPAGLPAKLRDIAGAV